MKSSHTPNPAKTVNYPNPEGWVETEATVEILKSIPKRKDRHEFMMMVAECTKCGLSRDRIQDMFSTCREEDIRGYVRPHKQGSESETRPQGSGDSRQAPARLPGWRGPGSGPSSLSWSGVGPPSSTANQQPYGPISNSDYGRSEPYHSPYGSSSNAYPSYQASATLSDTYSGNDVKPYRDGLVHPSWIDRHGGASGGSDQGRHGLVEDTVKVSEDRARLFGKHIFGSK